MTNVEAFFEEHGIVEKIEPPPAGAPDTLELVWFGDARTVTDMGDFIEATLTDSAMSVIYGESNSGKSFFAMDMALRVALGWQWQGKDIEGGAVLYLACEGGKGIQNRIAAFREAHEVTSTPPFAVVPSSVNLRDHDGDTGAVIRTAAAMKDRTGKAVRLIVVDTLARAMAGGEENSSMDMGAVVRSCDAIRAATGAHVMLIHHSGKDMARGARGHSSLRAATDTEIEVARGEDGTAVATTKKQRDLPGEATFGFRLKPVELGIDRRGNPVTSCVVEPTDAPASAKPKVTLSDEQKAFLEALRNALVQHGETVVPIDGMAPITAVGRNHLRNHLVQAGFLDSATATNNQRATLSKYLNKLKGKQLVGLTKDYAWIV